MHRGIKSNLLLPVARIAAAVKTGNDQEGIGFDEKKERVGKFLRLRAPLRVRRAKRNVELSEETTVWSWHAEQKIIRYLKKYFGIESRATPEALGIAHIGGPCNPTTAGQGHQMLRGLLIAQVCEVQQAASRPPV